MVFASELFVRSNAKFLNVAILVVMEACHQGWQYDTYWPHDDIQNMTMADYHGDYILIGNSESLCQFQSLRFVGVLPWYYSMPSDSINADIDFQLIPKTNTSSMKGVMNSVSDTLNSLIKHVCYCCER